MKSLRGLLHAGVLVLAVGSAPVLAAELININTADPATLQTLNGIGPAKAQAIIDYRAKNGPFARIEDIMNVNGIGTATFNNIKDFITVGSPQSQTQTQTETQTQSQTQPQAPVQTEQTSASGGYAPPPITVVIAAQKQAVVGAGTYFEGAAYGTQHEPLASARLVWNFGDGATAEGPRVTHTYVYPGTYVAVLTGANNFSTAQTTLVITASVADIGLVAETDGSLTILNHTTLDLDIGGWSLLCGERRFFIPSKTFALAGGGVRFAPAVTSLACGMAAQLRYQNGSLAAKAELPADSPLHGERVSSAQVKALQRPPVGATVAAAYRAAETSPGESATDTAALSAAAAQSPAPSSGWLYAAGLGALVVFGAAAAWYARAEATRSGETTPSAEEFDIT